MTCIGNGHPTVRQAIKDQVDKLSCELGVVSRRPFTQMLPQMFTTCNYLMSLPRS